MRILFLSRWFPSPPNNGSKIRIYNLLQGLGQRYNVTLLSFFDRSEGVPDTSALRAFCREVHVVPWKTFSSNSWRARFGLLNSTPRSMVDTFSSEMRQLLEQQLSTADYDVIIASEIDMVIYGQYFQKTPALVDELQVGVLYQRFAQAKSWQHRLRYGLTWTKYRRYLTTTLKNFQSCVVVSRRERHLLSQAVTGYQSIEVIPNCIDLESYSDIDEVTQPNTLIFTGSFSFSPNYYAMVWFLREAYPHIQTQVPDIRLYITGKHNSQPLPPANNVTLTGFVDDVRPLIARSWASVVPIHTGGGTRLKILEAMALGTPVVTTSKGAEGIEAQHNEHLLIADTPETFAQEVIRLLNEPELRQQLVDNAYQLAREKYDWAVVMPRFLDLVERVAGN